MPKLTRDTCSEVRKYFPRTATVLAISLFAFLFCRYIGNIISLFAALGVDISHLGSFKLDRIYPYRYFVILIVVAILVLLNIDILKRLIVPKFKLCLGMFIRELKLKAHFKTIEAHLKPKWEHIEAHFKWKWKYILSATVLFSALNNYILLVKDTRQLMNDALHYLIVSTAYSNIFRFDFSALTQFFQPPLVMLTNLPFIWVFGESLDVAAMSNIIYLVVLALSVYGVGKYFHSRGAGILAAFITVTIPGVFAMSRIYLLDFPLAAMTSLSLYAFLKAEHFKNRHYSIFFGVSAALAFLTKTPYMLFFPATIGAYALLNIKEYWHMRKAQLKNMVIALLLLLLIAAPWYIANAKFVIGESWGNIKGEAAKELPAGTVKEESFKVRISCHGFIIASAIREFGGSVFTLAKLPLSLFYSFTLLFALACFLLRKKDKLDWLLLMWIFVPFFFWFYTSLPPSVLHSIHRYIVPSLPAIAIFISISVFKLRSTTLKLGVFAAIITFGMLNYFMVSYASEDIFGIDVSTLSEDYGIYSARRGDPSIDKILEVILPLRENVATKVLYISESFPPLTANYISYKAQAKGWRLEVTDPIIGAHCFKVYATEFDNEPYRKQFLLSSDYVVLVQGGKDKYVGNAGRRYSSFISTFNENKHFFEMHGKFPLPDGSYIVIWRKLQETH